MSASKRKVVNKNFLLSIKYHKNLKDKIFISF